VPAIQSVANEIGPKLTPVFKALGDYFTNVLIPAFTTLYNFIRDYIVPILNVTLIPIITALAKAWTTIANALRENSAELEPLRKAFYAFAGFLRDTVAPIIGTFISGAIGGIAGVISALIGVVGDVTTAVNSGFNRVKNFFNNVVSFISDSAGDLVAPIVNVFRAAINTIIGLWNRLDFRITFSVPDWVPIIGGNSWRSPDIFPDIPYLAKGGIVNSPTLAMIGEAGPEAVIPLNKSGLMGNNINVTVNGAIDPESTARQIITILNNSSYRGTLGAGAFAS
jgi:Flp pilus assembly pilin Flp